ncbi:MAG TPA: metallophosphoesterase [Candidatus Nanoarchaeia archaeon]|nr:metallophosphoesterase [Candidatus Nanoarchaeia archaeon]
MNSIKNSEILPHSSVAGQTKDILGFCLKNGLLIDNELLNLFSGTTDAESAKLIIEKIRKHTNHRIITKKVFYENKDIEGLFSELSEQGKEGFKRLKIKLGLSIEISKEMPEKTLLEEETKPNVKIVSIFPAISKKYTVADFTNHFRNRFSEMKNFLQERPELTNLISISKLAGNKQNVSLIGMVSDKRITKNKNIILTVEDLTGKIKVIITEGKKEVYTKADDISLDLTVGFRGSGNREVFFANDIFFPDTTILERKNSPTEECAIFISDIHAGSKLFFEKSFLKFVDYLNLKVPGTEEEARKIKYLFVVGDLIAGVGIYPGQEKDLKIKDIEGQYSMIAELFKKIRKDINLIILPGNHDCVRLAEPQPVLDEKYAWPLFELENLTLTSNPSMINIGASENFSGFNVLAYHGFSFPYFANNIPKLITADAINSPDKIMHYLLQNRHLAPAHTSVQYSPHERDPLVIRNAPDIFVSGHTHKGAVSYYNNILVLSSTCWENLTAFQEKVGAKPDFCKVPMFNLKTRQVKILDFYEKDD